MHFELELIIGNQPSNVPKASGSASSDHDAACRALEYFLKLKPDLLKGDIKLRGSLTPSDAESFEAQYFQATPQITKDERVAGFSTVRCLKSNHPD